MRKSGRGGFALMLTVFLTIVLLAMVSLLHRHLRAVVQTTRAEGFIDGMVDEARLGLSRGLTLLETGTPPSGSYACLLTMSDRAGSPVAAISYEYNQAQGTWSVVSSTQDLGGVTIPCPETWAGS
jgi:hypothetical protein